MKSNVYNYNLMGWDARRGLPQLPRTAKLNEDEILALSNSNDSSLLHCILYKYILRRKKISFSDIIQEEREGKSRSYLFFCRPYSREMIEAYGKLLYIAKWVICNLDSWDRTLIKFKIHHKIKLNISIEETGSMASFELSLDIWHRHGQFSWNSSDFDSTSVSSRENSTRSIFRCPIFERNTLNPRKCLDMT